MRRIDHIPAILRKGISLNFAPRRFPLRHPGGFTRVAFFPKLQVFVRARIKSRMRARDVTGYAKTYCW